MANVVVISGRLTKDPEVRETNSGKTVTSFTVANDKPGRDAGTNFFDVVAWEKRGETIAQYFTKGSFIIVEGTLNHETWEQDGQKRSRVNIVLDNFTFGPKNSDAAPAQQKSQDVVLEDIENKPIDLSEIPF